jgi:phosphate transport system substrate-binding protein
MARDRNDRALTWCLALVLCAATACSRGDEAAEGGALSGAIESDGSSTVLPIAEAVAEEFQIAHPDARVTVARAGTGGGFQRFCAGETDISNASRPISEDERAACSAAGIEFIEMPVAWDGLSVVANSGNTFLQCLTMEELKRIWEPNSTVTNWRDLRPSLPAERISLYGPGTDSGTFDYFTEEVVGTTGSSRADYQASEDDNILVQGVAGDANSLGYYGYAYYLENQSRLKLVGVDAGTGCIVPNDETIANSTYPLSRPLFIYVKRASLERPVVAEFVRFFMESAAELVPSTGYHALDAAAYQENLAKLQGP